MAGGALEGWGGGAAVARADQHMLKSTRAALMQHCTHTTLNDESSRSLQKVGLKRVPVCCHAIRRGHRPQCHYVRVGALVALHACGRRSVWGGVGWEGFGRAWGCGGQGGGGRREFCAPRQTP